MKTSENPEIKRLLGTEGEFGTALGLGNDWAQHRQQVGNYGEVFDANVGPEHRSGNCAWHQCPVVAGRPAIRTANPLQV